MHTKRVATISSIWLALFVCFTNLEAQIISPVLSPSIALKAAVTDGGKVQLAWENLTRDTVRFYSIYRAMFPDTLRVVRIDSVTRREYTDTPPRTSTVSIYVYFVTGITTKGSILQSNVVVVVVHGTNARDIVRITSTPNENAEVNTEYRYNVKAVSSDSSAKLTYSLATKPLTMTIDSSGVIKWTPRERGFALVEVRVKSSKGGEASQRFTIRVAGGSGIVEGTATDTSGTKPVRHVVVRVYKVDFSNSFDYKAVTDSMGKYKIDRVDPGSYYLRAEPMDPAYLPQWYDGASSQRDAKAILVSNNATTVVNLKLQLRYKPIFFTVRGNVVDSANHAPLKDASVCFVQAGFALNGSRGFAADPTQAHDIRTMFDYNPSFDHRLDGTNAQFVFKTRTDAMGKYSLQLPRGSYIAFAEAIGHVKIFQKQKTNLLTADTILVNSNLDGINFNLPPIPAIVLGEINGTIVDSSTGRGVRSRVIAFRDLWVEPVILNPPPRTYVPGCYVTDTDSTGKYSIGKVLPGQYFVLAIPLGNYAPAFYSTGGSTQNWRLATKVAVNGNIVAGIYIFVKPLVRMVVGYTFVSGTVSTASNSGKLGKVGGTVGVIGALVYAVDGNGAIYGYDVTDESGTYAIAGVAPGSYTLFVDAPGFSSPSPRVALPTYATDVRGTPQPAAGVNFTLGALTSAPEDEPLVPSGYILEQNYPNPFNPTTQILFSTPQSENVSLTIYNLLGQKIATLVDGTLAAGTHSVTWNGRDAQGMQLPSGVYFYTLRTAGYTASKRMVMLK